MELIVQFFLTGKAGTGKTTLLKEIVEHTHKSVVIVAPTGIAALNAGGVTIHSMFQIPPACYAPALDFENPNISFTTAGRTALRSLRGAVTPASATLWNMQKKFAKMRKSTVLSAVFT